MKAIYLASLLMVLAAPSSNTSRVDVRSKVIIEREVNRKMSNGNAMSDALSDLNDNENKIMTIALDYEVDEDIHIDSEKSIESIIETEEYFYNKNMQFIEQNNLDTEDYFVSSYTPFIFLNYSGESINSVYSEALEIASSDQVATVYIGNESSYEFENNQLVEELGRELVEVNEVEQQSSLSRPIPTPLRPYNRTAYDGFPDDPDIYYTGTGVKVGILDKGSLDPTAEGLTSSNIFINDSVTSNDSIIHPTQMARIISSNVGGIAPNAQIHFTDVANSTGLTAIESLSAVDVICIGVSHITPVTGGSYSTSTDLYIDYFYKTSRVVMVAGTGDTNEYEDMAYVTCPASASSVIAVGSVNYDRVPSAFSNYVNFGGAAEKSDYDKPHISAIGENRRLPGAGMELVSGTKFSAAAVTGALALLKQRYRSDFDFTSAVVILEMTSDHNDINNDSQTINLYSKDVNDVNGNGNRTEYLMLGATKTMINYKKGYSNLRERTGAGLLNISLIFEDFDYELLSSSRTWGPTASVTMPVTYDLELGDIIQLSLAYEINITRITLFPLSWYAYSAFYCPKIEIYKGTSLKGIYTFSTQCTNMGRHIVESPGRFSVRITFLASEIPLITHFNYGIYIIRA